MPINTPLQHMLRRGYILCDNLYDLALQFQSICYFCGQHF